MAAIVSPANLSFFFTTLNTMYWQAFGVAPPWWMKVAQLYPMTTEQLGFGWMGMLDQMRPWTGSRVVRQPAPETYFVRHRPFELTLSIDQFKLADDLWGIYFPTVQFMGRNAAKWPDYQLRNLIRGLAPWTGGAQIGLDGLTHWNTAHPIDVYDATKGTYINDFTGAPAVNGINTGGALGPNAYATLWQEFVSRKSQSGEALGLVPNLTMLPPQLHLTALTLLTAAFFSPSSLGNFAGNVGATENVLRGSTDMMMVPEFAADPSTWYMLDTTGPVKPFSWCLRAAPDFVYRNQPQDPVVFDQHTYLFGSKAQGVSAWGHAFLSARSAP
jgi:phage major head subunit gpT-like protein